MIVWAGGGDAPTQKTQPAPHQSFHTSLLPSAVTGANGTVPALLCFRFGMKLPRHPPS